MLRLPRPSTDDSCVRIGLLFEQTRGRDVQVLLHALGASAWVGVPFTPTQQATLVRALHRRLKSSPTHAVIFALKGTADPAALRPLLEFVAQHAADPAQEELVGAALNALLSIEWPEAWQAALLVAEKGLGEARDQAIEWLTLFPPPPMMKQGT